MTKSRFKGRQALKRKFQELPAAVVEAAREGLAAGAQDIVDMQKRLAPVDRGDLRDSIAWRFGDDANQIKHAFGAGRLTKKRNPVSVRITAGNARVRTAHLVEFGTAPHTVGGIFAGAQHPGTKPQPFFYPAYRARKKAAAAKVKRAVNRAAKKVFAP